MLHTIWCGRAARTALGSPLPLSPPHPTTSTSRRLTSSSATFASSQSPPSSESTSFVEAEKHMKWGSDLAKEWGKNHAQKHPLYQNHAARYWELFPQAKDGWYVLDFAGVITDVEKFAKLNDICRGIEEKHKVKVVFMLMGELGSQTSPHLARTLGSYWTRLRKESGEDPYENFVFVFASRKDGTLHTYVGKGVRLIFNPVWVQLAFNRIFKVYFRGREWDQKMLEYAEAFDASLKARPKWVQHSGKVAWLPLALDYWWAIVPSVVLLVLFLLDYREFYHYWDERYCTKCQVFMQGYDDPKLLREKCSLGQRKEMDLDCVKYALWKCPTEDCDTSFVETVKWNSLRLECLICQKCHFKCSKGERVVANIPDADNFGEALNVRTCKFCGFQEAWSSVMRAASGSGQGDHDRPLAGDYGSKAWVTFTQSGLGRTILGNAGAAERMLRRDGAGEASDKETSYPARFYLPFFRVVETR